MCWLIGIAVFWVVCGVLAYGAMLAFLQRACPSEDNEEEYAEDAKTALILSLFGPIGLCAALELFGFKHGLMYRNPHKGEK